MVPARASHCAGMGAQRIGQAGRGRPHDGNARPSAKGNVRRCAYAAQDAAAEGVAVRVGIVGATGQVGTVMRRILKPSGTSRSTELRLFASARSAGTVPGRRDGGGRGDRRLHRPGHRAVLGGRRDVEGAGREGRRAGRGRDRQLLRVAQGPRGPAGRLRGEPARDRGPPQGHHRQPELHDDGRDAGAAPAARGGGSGGAGRRHVPGGVRLRPGGRGGAARPGRRRSSPTPTS